MGFWKKMVISATSGLFGKIVLVVAVSLGIGFASTKFIALPEDSVIAKDLMRLLRFVVGVGLGILAVSLPMILRWLSERRQDRIRELELKKEILELEIQKENQQSPLDNQE